MFPVNDFFDAILVGGFLFGLLFTIGSVVFGFADIGGDADADFDADVNGGDGGFSSLFNVSSVLAFITWFSGTTYLLRNAAGWAIGFAVVVGLVIGIAGAYAIAWFLYSFLRENSPELNPSDWDEIGQIGRVIGTIRETGIGEVVYERHGTRHSIPARTKDGVGIERGVEVVIMDIERGVAIVQQWEELMAEHTSKLD